MNLFEIPGQNQNRIHGITQKIGDNLTFYTEKEENGPFEKMFHGFKVALTFGNNQINAVEFIEKLFA